MPQPKQKPGLSKQDYGTPKPFLDAVRRFLGIIDFDCDLFADSRNTVCAFYYSIEQDAFLQPWKLGDGWNWANPEFKDASRVVQCVYGSRKIAGAQTCVLLPAGVSTNWFAEWVHQKAYVLFVRPRLTFVGCKDPYPKDLMLLLYSPQIAPEYHTWRWDE